MAWQVGTLDNHMAGKKPAGWAFFPLVSFYEIFFRKITYTSVYFANFCITNQKNYAYSSFTL